MSNKIEQEKVIDWLNQKWIGEKKCPICNFNNWAISEQILELREYSGGGLKIGGPVYPLFSLTCQNCGHTLLFNSLVSKVLIQEENIENQKKDNTPPNDKVASNV